MAKKAARPEGTPVKRRGQGADRGVWALRPIAGARSDGDERGRHGVTGGSGRSTGGGGIRTIWEKRPRWREPRSLLEGTSSHHRG